jgi:hypothetical protein
MPQAWPPALDGVAAGMPGLGFDTAGRIVRFEHPVLPEWLEQVHLGAVTLGSDSVDVQLLNRSGSVSATVLSRTGTVRVVSIN